ncbi:hypothetical protein AB6D66_26950 [Vibrio pomeroyi]|uniref:Uncharacterized protein n=1 Tax=Vibrio pomeroyi TaxID=198832 RepID=A0ABV4N5E8_9VIBR
MTNEEKLALIKQRFADINEDDFMDGETFFNLLNGDSLLCINLEDKTPEQVRQQLRQHRIELPLGFDFRQHQAITIDTEKQKVIAVVKRY